MKKKFSMSMFVSLALVFAVCGSAQAHFMWMDPIGEQLSTPGDRVDVNVWLHATQDDQLYLWALDLGFDQTELSDWEIAYGSTNLILNPMAPLTEDDSNKYEGKRAIYDVSAGFGLPDFKQRDELTAGEDHLLFTAFFNFNGGTWDGEDIWVEMRQGMGFGFDNAGWIDQDHMLVYTDNTGSELLGDNGPDYAPVPIPAAVWLLGSGLLGLIGIRRKVK